MRSFWPAEAFFARLRNAAANEEVLADELELEPEPEPGLKLEPEVLDNVGLFRWDVRMGGPMLEGFEDNTEMKLKEFSLESYTVKAF